MNIEFCAAKEKICVYFSSSIQCWTLLFQSVILPQRLQTHAINANIAPNTVPVFCFVLFCFFIFRLLAIRYKRSITTFSIHAFDVSKTYRQIMK